MPFGIPIRTRSFALFGVILCLFALRLSGAGIAAAATGDSIADDPGELRARLLEHRSAEAAVKARRAEAWMRGAELRTPNQELWDVKHYDLELTVDPSTTTLSGTVTTTAEVLTGPLVDFELQLDLGMTVSAVTAGGSATTWTHSGGIVDVTLDRSYATGETVVVAVTYSGNPAGESFGWSSADGTNMIWTLSEPFGARDWWPCKDLNRDKADSVDVRVAVPDPLIVASNGLLQSTTPAGGWTTYHWKTTYPISTYLVSLAIHPYTTFSHTYTPLGGGSMPVDYYVFGSNYSAVQSAYLVTVPILEAFAGGYGEYPFVNEKYGHAEFTWGGGMEHQTLTSLGGWSEDLISHEAAHQWWGDMVTCKTFKHIWLNEGFATWSEAYWKEQSEGFATYQQYMDAAAYYGPGTIFVENTAFDDIFDVNLSYNKASWVPHMLRGVMGDTDFFAGLAHYRSLYEGGVATTEDFQAAMETVSGLDLSAFFQEWIYGEYYPVYQVVWSETTPGTVDLTIDQVQTNTGLFTMPIDVRVTTSSGTYDFEVQNSLASENYQLAVSGDVESVVIDPDHWILREVETFVTNPTFDSGILVVNGVDWPTYDTEIRSAYADSVFWADLPFTFWDNFAEPAGGYPANLPAPAGHGSVPADILGKYSTVVWVGNNYAGDLPKWSETPIESYLSVGGNVLLLTRRGDTFIGGDLEAYLGITLTDIQATLSTITAVDGSMVNVGLIGSQSFSDVFSTAVGPNSTLLLQSTIGGGGPRGSGVIVVPPGGGTERPDGGRFAYFAGRPYRMNHANLRDNVETILKTWFGEPYSGAIGLPGTTVFAGELSLSAGAPNPFRTASRIAFRLPEAGAVELTVYDVSGRLVRILVKGIQAAGPGAATWDGRDLNGERAASGVYFVRLRTDDAVVSRPLVRLK